MQIDKKKLLLKELPSVRQMLAFITVYKYGHMSAAAEELSLTQPAVTVLIRELEQKLNTQLFDRATRSLKPTHAATMVLPYIKRALNELIDMQDMIKDFNHLNTGHLRLAVTPNSTQNLLGKILQGFIEQYPTIEIDIIECDPLELMSVLINEKADLCLGILEKDMPFIESHVIFQDEIVAIYHPDMQLKTSLKNWYDVSQERLILTNRGYGIRQKIEQKFQQISPNISIQISKEVSLISTVIALVQSGLGVGLVPLSSVAHKCDIYVQKHFAEPIFREISIFHLKEKSLSPAVQAFIQHCKNIDQHQFTI